LLAHPVAWTVDRGPWTLGLLVGSQVGTGTSKHAVGGRAEHSSRLLPRK
jgi:hypothetical protein